MKTKPAEASAAPIDKVATLRSALRSAPPKKGVHSRSPLKAAVAQLLPDLLAFRAKGYSGAELAEIMRDNGLVIAVATLNRYMNEASATRRKGKAQGIAAEPETKPLKAPSKKVDGASTMAGPPPISTTKTLQKNRRGVKEILGHQFDYDV